GTVSGDGWIEGKVGAQIRAGGTKIWVYLDTSELERKPETQLGTEAVLAMGLYLGTDCRWSGQWNYHSLNSAECEAVPCAGIEVDELGEFSAESSCDLGIPPAAFPKRLRHIMDTAKSIVVATL